MIKWVFNIDSNLKLHPTKPDGNCFFSSIQLILSSIGINRTIQDLRHIVAKPVLDTLNETVNETIKNWLGLYQSAIKEENRTLCTEYIHMRGLEKSTWPLTAEERKLLYNNMMSSTYWGEQHACRMIEEKSNMRFFIFNGDLQKPQLSWYHSSSYSPSHYCFLYLSGQHYSPVSLWGDFIYLWENIPTHIQDFFRQSYKVPLNTTE
jgi:hypothetical protein